MLKEKQKDISQKLFILIAILLVTIKLVLTSLQSVYLLPYISPIDDMLMYNAAESILHGNWLGTYNWLTLSKYAFFSVWVALLNILHIPYLIGGQLLWAGAVCTATGAFKPLIQKRRIRILLFALLLYNPAVSAAEVQLRVYRDNIFPALCLLCIGGFIGAALRIKNGVSGYVGYIICGGIGLALAWVTREDGLWLLPFALGATVCIVTFLIKEKADKRILKGTLLLLPYCLVCAVILSFCTVNYAYYGRFVLSDLTSREFKDAYGALSRVEHENWQPKVAVPYDVRQKLYLLVPELARIEPALERGYFYGRYGIVEDKEFTTGGFHWALREAAGDAGIYSDANTAKEYFKTVADKVNKLCDDGVIKAGPRRSSTTAPIRKEYVLPVLKDGFKNIWRALSFEDCYPMFNDLTYATPLELTSFERILNEKPVTVAISGTSKPYYNLAQRMAHGVLIGANAVYTLIMPFLFGMALMWVYAAARSFAKREKRENPLLFIIMLGVLLAIMLRSFMISFMFVSSFNDNLSRVMYLSSIHPMLILFAFVGTLLFVKHFKNKKGDTNWQI
ncbi:MAG: hypothetical protein RR978_01280 [Oscillospiraceae bacterium]